MFCRALRLDVSLCTGFPHISNCEIQGHFKGNSGVNSTFSREVLENLCNFVINSISCNFKIFFGLCNILSRVSIIFLKHSWWQNRMKLTEKKRYLCWSIFCVFHKFQGNSRFLHKIPDYFHGSRNQNKFQAFQGFQGAVGTLYIRFTCFLKLTLKLFSEVNHILVFFQKTPNHTKHGHDHCKKAKNVDFSQKQDTLNAVACSCKIVSELLL